MRNNLSCGHSGKVFLSSATTTNCRSGPQLSNPMVRMAGLEVRYKNDMSDSRVPSKIAISSRMVTVATSVASATPNSVRLKLKS